MKELTTKEATIDVIRQMVADGQVSQEVAERYFPELKESEDDRIKKALITFFQRFPYENIDAAGTNVKEAIAWLEKQGEQKQELRKTVWATVEHKNDKETIHKMSDLSFFLKTLKPQLRQEWSEEDEKMVGNIRRIIEQYAFSNSAVDVNGELCEKEYIDADNFLKSLKERYTWKPSDGQMKALNYVVNLMALSESPKENDYYYNVFKDLRQQLKKLREE